MVNISCSEYPRAARRQAAAAQRLRPPPEFSGARLTSKIKALLICVFNPSGVAARQAQPDGTRMKVMPLSAQNALKSAISCADESSGSPPTRTQPGPHSRIEPGGRVLK